MRNSDSPLQATETSGSRGSRPLAYPPLALLARALVFLLVLGAASEIVFRTAVPASQPPLRFRDASRGLTRRDVTGPREGRFTSGRLAQQRSHWRINQAGWNSPQEYLPPGPGRPPVVAVIGNSYGEGLYVDGDEHLASVLQRSGAGKFLVYSFGQPGASMMQYVNMARYAREEFNPEVFVFLVVTQDIWSSIREFRAKPDELQIVFEGAKPAEVAPKVGGNSRLKRILRGSATLQYLVGNAHLRLFEKGGEGAGLYDAPRGVDLEEFYERQQEAARFILETLKRDHPGKKLIFLVDGARARIYQEENPASLPEATILKEVCAGSGCTVIDMNPVFIAHYRRYGERFNFDHDYHWNALAYRLGAEALAPALTAPEKAGK